MYKPIKLKLKNFKSFENDVFYFNNNKITNIVGENNTDEGQKRNGSGKTSILDAISFLITGESITNNVNKNLVRRGENEANLELELLNTITKETLIIKRSINVKTSAKCSIYLGDKIIEKSSPLEYNKWISEELDISSSYIFKNFIINDNNKFCWTENSDSDKKEIVYKFSKADKIDKIFPTIDSIIDKYSKKLEDKNKEKISLEGKIELLEEQKIKEINEFEKNNKEKISLKEKDIEKIKTKINELNTIIENDKKYLEDKKPLEEIDNELKELNHSSLVKELKFKINNIDLSEDVKNKIEHKEKENIINHNTILSLEEECKIYSESLTYFNEDINKISILFKNMNENDFPVFLKEKEKANEKINRIKEEICELNKEYENNINIINNGNDVIDDENKNLKNLNDNKKKYLEDIKKLDLAKIDLIECPKCTHTFSFKNINVTLESIEYDINEINTKLSHIDNNINVLNIAIKEIKDNNELLVNNNLNIKNNIKNLNEDIFNIESSLQDILKEEKNNYSIENNKKIEINNSNIFNIKQKINNCKSVILDIKSEIDKINFSINSIKEKYIQEETQKIQNQINELDTKFIYLNNLKNEIEIYTQNINKNKNYIINYQEEIKLIENFINNIKNNSVDLSLEKIQNQINIYTENKEVIESFIKEHEDKLQKYNNWKLNFLSFKSYLANKCLTNIELHTNNYLEQINSNLKISILGFKVNANKEIKEKISINISRNNEEEIPYTTLSKGEKCRINLCLSLTLQSLINTSSKNGGLDLMIIDEVLDGLDELGYKNIIESFKDLNKTLILISQNNLDDVTQFTKIVRKENGISKFIN